MKRPPRKTSWRRLLTLLLLGGAAVLVAQLYARTHRDRVNWGDAVPAAREASATSGKPVLMYFGSDWCGGCFALKARVFSDERIAARIDNEFEAVHVDLTRSNGPGTPWALEYEVMMIPLVVATDAAGNELARLETVPSRDEFSGWLDRIHSPRSHVSVESRR